MTCRIHYGDGTPSGEERAWENFLAICRKPAPGILEFSGMGPHVEDVRDNLLCSTIPLPAIGYAHAGSSLQRGDREDGVVLLTAVLLSI